MGSFYSGFGGYKSYLGHCEDGIIYSGSGNHTPVGRYENGNIYNKFKQRVGSYSGGGIYDAFGTHIASYDGGVIYNQYLNAVVGREQIGSYDCEPAEAAALVLLFLNKNTKSDNSSDSGSNSMFPSLMRNIGTVIGTIIGFILRYTIGLLFREIILPLYSAATLWVLLALIICVSLFSEVVAILLLVYVLETLLIVAFIPYWFRVKKQKRLRNLSKNDFGRLWAMWFLKGPWAYKDLKALENLPLEK